jgi:hypothetical protein
MFPGIHFFCNSLILDKTIKLGQHANEGSTNKGKKKMSIKLESSDEQVFEVPREVVEMSLTIKNMLADIDSPSTDSIPLSITGNILAKVLHAPPLHVPWRATSLRSSAILGLCKICILHKDFLVLILIISSSTKGCGMGHLPSCQPTTSRE